MAVVIDKLLGTPLLHEHLLNNVTSDPASGKDGQLILNTTDHVVRVWYGGAWQDLHTLSADPSGTNYTFMDDSNFEFMDGTQFEFMNA